MQLGRQQFLVVDPRPRTETIIDVPAPKAHKTCNLCEFVGRLPRFI
jgi:hypothetical protein